ncbi:MAG: hypothetical protein JWR89_5229 [Tardiphaga sp.]|nr:hypothetical protein [Tardiphaga sp.]
MEDDNAPAVPAVWRGNIIMSHQDGLDNGR